MASDPSTTPDLTGGEELHALVDSCMLADRHRLTRQLGNIRRKRGHGGSAMAQVQERIENSRNRAQQRQQQLPEITVNANLPIADHAEQLAAAIRKHQVVIVAGETGSGKSTQLPKICLQAGRGIFGQIGHTQPRRVAARSIANRLATELDRPLGTQIGYKVRFNDQSGADCLVKVMTDGILLAESRSDRWLNQYDTLIIDEAHERSLNIDFLLGMLKRLLQRRPELKLIITSATIDTAQFSQFFADAPVFEVSGRGYPVEMRYRPLTRPAGHTDDADSADDPVAATPASEKSPTLSAVKQRQAADINQGILAAIDELAAEGPGDMLVFLPGERDIVDAEKYLAQRLKQRFEILPLYSRLSQADQDRIFKQRQQRRVILATNVAETSLTVPGIHYVIDSGLARVSRYSSRLKIQRLPIEKISQASASQRAGRCGRIAPGICIRLYAEDDFNNRAAQTEPEIVRTNLASVILQMLNLRMGDPQQFPFIDAPQRRLIRDGYLGLTELGALIDEQQLSLIGKQLAQLPIDPRLGRMLIAARDNGGLYELAIITAGLTIQDPRERPREFQQQADQRHRLFQHPESDFITLLNLWNSWQEQAEQLSNSKLRRWCRDHYLNYMRMREWQDLHRQLQQQIRQQGWPQIRIDDEKLRYQRIHEALICGLLSNLARQTERRDYQGARNTQLKLFPGSALAKAPPAWIVAAELVETSQLFARTAARIERQWIEPLAGHLLHRSYSEPHWSAKKKEVFAFEKVTLFGLPVVDRRRTRYSDIDPVESRRLFIRDGLVADQYTENFHFITHNRELVAEIEELEVRTRRHDLLADDEKRITFFDHQLPAEICNGYKFKTWYRRQLAEGKDASTLLCYSRELLMNYQLDDSISQLYPSHWSQAGVAIPLEYRFAPTDPQDGLTLALPLAMLNQLDATACDYLIPGLLPQKVESLLRQLPKPLRRQLVPLPDRAAEITGDPPEKDEGVVEYIQRRIRALTGIEIPNGAMSRQSLPSHLRLHLQIVDEEQQPLALSDDVSQLKENWQQQASTAFSGLEQKIEERQVTEWDFGDLPDAVDSTAGATQIRGYPALQLRGNSLYLTVVDSSEKATRAHIEGVYWLLARQLRKRRPGILPTRHDLQPFTLITAQGKARSESGNAHQLVNDLIQLILGEVYDLNPPPRTEAAFQALLKQPTEDLKEISQRWLNLLEELTKIRGELARQTAKLPIHLLDTGQQIQRQLSDLIYPGFLSQTPRYWLPHLPRYLKAMQIRLERADLEPKKERQQRTVIAPLQQRWNDCPAHLRDHPDWVEYRWTLEELRVALFAQPLKTHRTVSVEKLEQLARKLPRE